MAIIQAGEAFLTLDRSGWGSIGGFFRLQGYGNTVFALTNSHVVANCGSAEIGAEIWFGKYNYMRGIQDQEIAGTLFTFTSLSIQKGNYWDFALVELKNYHAHSWSNFERPLDYVREDELVRYQNHEVQIFGGRSRNRYGIFKGIEREVKRIEVKTCSYNKYNFLDMLIVEGYPIFSETNDSGSLIRTLDNRILGVLIGRVDESGYYSFGFPFHYLWEMKIA